MTLSQLIVTAIVGLIVGLLARLILPGRDPMGLIMTAILGIAGSFLGTLVKHYLFNRSGQAGWILSVAGAVLLVWLYRLIAARQT
jgi:uncharacterized membrane protein YeaQ/YmgE (transglycosylase-associated protein family)